MVGTQGFHCRGLGSIPGHRIKFCKQYGVAKKRLMGDNQGSKSLLTKAGCGCPESYHPTGGLDTNNSQRGEMTTSGAQLQDMKCSKIPLQGARF